MVTEYNILLYGSVDMAVTNYHQIHSFYQGDIRSVNYTRVTNYPIN